MRWYKKGVLQKDAKKKLKGATYYFNKKGNAVRGKGVKVGKAYWVFGDDGKLLKPGKKKYYRLAGGLYYVDKKGHPAKTGFMIKNGRLRHFGDDGKVTVNAYVQGILFEADGWAKSNLASKLKMTVMKRIAKICDESWSRSRKLQRCWYWALGHGTFVNSSALQDLDKPAWVQRQAYKTMNSSSNECFGTACSFAMMAYELGYTPIVHGAKHVHAFVYVNGKRYDNMARHLHNMWGEKVFKVTSYSGVKDKKIKQRKVGGVKVPASGTGWAKKGGAYYYFRDAKMLKSQWVSVAGKKYYLLKSGKAATGPKKVKVSNNSSKKAYFLFSTKRGTLLTGSGAREVKLGGTVYRASAKGRALAGWAKDASGAKVACYAENGARYEGVCLVDGKLCAFTAKGVYKAEQTKKLRRAAVVGADVTAFKELMGKPVKTVTDKNSCRPSFESADGVLEGYGVERTLFYDHVKVYTYKAPGGKTEYLSYYESVG